MKKIIAAGIASGVFLIAGCSGSHGYGEPIGQADTTSFAGSSPAPQGPSTALFKVLSGVLPYPFDVWFAGKLDGTLNTVPNPFLPGVNALDGFSTTAPIREAFAGKIDAASLARPGAVVMVHIATNNAGPEAKAPVSPLKGGKFIPLKGCLKDSPGCLPVALTGPCAPAGCDYAVGIAADDPTILEITPLKPLAASTCLPLPSPCAVPPIHGFGEGYMVLLTKAITVGGVAAVADSDYASFQAALAAGGPSCPSITNADLNAVCRLTGAHLALAQLLPGIKPADVVASFSFSTGSTLDTLAAATLEAAATPQLIKVNPLLAAPNVPLTTADLPAPYTGKGWADIYVGVLTLPYYLSKSEPDTGFWHASGAKAPNNTNSTFTTRFNPIPLATQTLQVPVLMTVPNAHSLQAQPGTGWPIAILEHGLTADRRNLLGIADSLAAGGMVGIAIDLPLHGLTVPYNPADPSTLFYASSSNPAYTGLGLPAAGSIERTFDLDSINKAEGVPGLDSSGSHWFAALASPLTVRDLLRESSVDLVTLALSVASIQLPPPATGPHYIDPTKIHYIGHSQGAIEGPVFLAGMSVLAAGIPSSVLNVQTATLASPGGEFVYLAFESKAFGPVILSLIEKASGGLLSPGTTFLATYQRDFQSVVDAGDPWNYIAQAAAVYPIHIVQVVGVPGTAGCNPKAPPAGCPDQVVPNDSTERIISAGGFSQLHPPGVPPGGGVPLHAFVNFTQGIHQSFLSPVDNLMVTEEMQFETISFTGQPAPLFAYPITTTPGTSLIVGAVDPTVIQ
jgi:hypothetical protein